MKRARLFWAMALLAALSTAGWGQLITASIEGIVLDPTGATVPNAKARAVDTSTGREVHSVTAADGRYSFPSLPPGGPYTVSVEASGFNTAARSGITLQVNQTLRLDFNLKIGATTETVQVTGAGPLVESTTASMGQVITSKNIVDLPLNQRNIYQLVFLAPGVQGSVSFTYNSDNFSLNGGRPGTTDILVDGIPSSPNLANPNIGMAVFPSVDAVQEFKVQTNTYSAEFGHSGSGLINLIYKSGTNSFHGSAYEFLRNSDLDSNTFFSNKNGTPLPNFKRSQFGGSLAGPVEIPKVYKGKDKTFFFVDYEGLRQGSATTLQTTVPTALQRTGNFSQTLNSAGSLVTIYDPNTTVAQGTGYVRTPFAGNIIPANRIDAVANNIINYYPSPNQPGLAFSGTNNYYVAATAIENTNSMDVKLDEYLSDRSRFFVRYSRLGLNQPAPVELPSAVRVAQSSPDNQAQTNNSAAIDYTLTLSPSDLIEFRYGFARIKLDYASISLGFNPTTLGFPGYIAANADHLLFPGVAPSNYYSLGNPGQGDTRSPGFSSHLLAVENTRILGAHTLRFGWEGRLLQSNDRESGSSTGRLLLELLRSNVWRWNVGERGGGTAGTGRRAAANGIRARHGGRTAALGRSFCATNIEPRAGPRPGPAQRASEGGRSARAFGDRRRTASRVSGQFSAGSTASGLRRHEVSLCRGDCGKLRKAEYESDPCGYFLLAGTRGKRQKSRPYGRPDGPDHRTSR